MAIEQPKGAVFIKATIGVIDGKWKLLILWHLRHGKKRFGELNRLIPEISEKVLTQQLRSLEKNDVIRRDVQPGNPPTVEYSFTEHGCSIIPILKPLCDWGEAHLANLEQMSPDS
ncbi:MAG: winged helix-turn-helix transcriptional regulator [Phormidesmis sp.]